jgi:hypothetical protein
MNDAVQTEDLEPEVDTTEETTEVLETEETEETEEGSETTEGEEEPKPSRSQNAKQRLRRKLRASEDENRHLLEQTKKQDERLATLEGKLEGVINPPPARPNRVNYETEEDYEDSLFEWRDSQKTQPVKKEPNSQRQQRLSVSQEVHENWMNQLDDASEKYDDFDDAMTSIPKESLSDSMTLAIMESKEAGEIAYFLGKNHSEATRIAGLSMTAQVREIDKLGTKLNNTTKAPDPIRTVNHRGDSTDEVNDPLIDGATFT